MATFKDFYQGRLALITGGSSGIGYALAKILADSGARVWLLARGKDRLNSAFQTLFSANGNRHGMLAADVSDWKQIQSTLERFQHEVGVPDLLINSAGVAHPGLLNDVPVEVYRELMDVNYFGTVHAVKALLPAMLERGSGYIVNISSGGGYASGPGYGPYCASKYAVRAFSDALRAELKPFGLRVSVVFPPNVDTPQRAYEKSLQTPEIRQFDEDMGIGPWKWTDMPASQAAEAILKGVQRGSYVIVVGPGNRVLYRLIGAPLLGNLYYSMTDDEWNTSRRKVHKG